MPCLFGMPPKDTQLQKFLFGPVYDSLSEVFVCLFSHSRCHGGVRDSKEQLSAAEQSELLGNITTSPDLVGQF